MDHSSTTSARETRLNIARREIMFAVCEAEADGKHSPKYFD